MWTSEPTGRVLAATLAGLLFAASVAAQPVTPAQGAADAASRQGGSSAEAQADRLRDVLLSWSRGKPLSHRDVRAVFSAGIDTRESSLVSCIRSVEEDVSSYLEEVDPSLLPTLAFWQTQMLLVSLDWSGQRTLRAADFDRIDDRLSAYRRRAAHHVKGLSKDEALHNTALTWTGIAELFSRRGSTAFYRSAARVLHKALEVEEDLLAARYLLAWVSEKFEQPIDMMRPWRKLMEDQPERAEYRLRFALNAVAASRRGQALEALPEVARSGGPDWVRALAYEEWVQLLLAEARGDEGARADARRILEEGRRELPASLGLDLLASYLDLDSRRSAALRLAERVESHAWPEGEMSPRLRYELPSQEEIAPSRAELAELLRKGQRDLGAYLYLFDADKVLTPRSRRACR